MCASRRQRDRPRCRRRKGARARMTWRSSDNTCSRATKARAISSGTAPRNLDILVDTASKHPACLGARLTGGGFGGATINMVKHHEAESFIAHMTAGYEKQVGGRRPCWSVRSWMARTEARSCRSFMIASGAPPAAAGRGQVRPDGCRDHSHRGSISTGRNRLHQRHTRLQHDRRGLALGKKRMVRACCWMATSVPFKR